MEINKGNSKLFLKERIELNFLDLVYRPISMLCSFVVVYAEFMNCALGLFLHT